MLDKNAAIETLSEFSKQLGMLDPEDDAFVLYVDELVEQTHPKVLESAYPEIFRFFEAHPESDCGAPGVLVHLTEAYYPNYVNELIESVYRKPSLNTVLMINRILNSQGADEIGLKLIDTLQHTVENIACSPLVKEHAQDYLTRHTKVSVDQTC